MNELLSVLSEWLLDVLVLGTALLGLAGVALVCVRQPAARMALARGTLLGLATLCIMTTLPSWPRQPLAEVFSREGAEEDRENGLSAVSQAGVIYPGPLTIDAPPALDESQLANAPTAPSLSISKLFGLLPLCWLGAAGCALAYIMIGACRAFHLLHNAAKAPAWSQQELQSLIAPKSRPPQLKTSGVITS